MLDDQGELRRHVNVFVDGKNVRFTMGLATRANPESENLDFSSTLRRLTTQIVLGGGADLGKPRTYLRKRASARSASISTPSRKRIELMIG